MSLNPRTPASGDMVPLIDSSNSNGSFRQTIPIEVPEFRGIEPNLDLVYDSASGARAGGFMSGLVGGRLAGGGFL